MCGCAVAAGVGVVGLGLLDVRCLGVWGWRLLGEGERTLSRHEERFAASCLARSRRRSYSASVLGDWRWLKAECIVSRWVSTLRGVWVWVSLLRVMDGWIE